MKGIAAAVLALTLAGCGGNGGAPSAVVTDSAGVRIVENGPAHLDAAERWTVRPQPILEVRPPEEGDLHLFQVGPVLPLPGGGFAVANGGEAQVLLFDAEGQLLRRVGRRGDGPGEFRRIASLVAMEADSLGVYDGDRRRLSIFAPEGELAREVDLGPLVPPMTPSVLLPLESSGEAVLFTSAGFPGAPEEGIHRYSSESFRVSPDGERLAAYGPFPGTEIFFSAEAMGPLLFGKLTASATLGDLLAVGTGDEPEVRLFAGDGALVRIVRWPDGDRAVTPERFQAFVEAGLATTPPEQRDFARSLLGSVPRAEEEPTLGGLVAAHEGDLWVGEYAGQEAVLPDARMSERQWLVFGADGGLKATISTPAGFSLHAVRQGTLLGVYRDELGVESIRILGVER